MAAAFPSLPRQIEQIVLVEDSPVQALNTRLILEKAGYVVHICSTGKAALAQIAEKQPDLILLDLNLPDISGLQVARELKGDAILSGIPIIFLTGVFRQVQDVIRGLDQADDYIDKAVEEEELVARVRASLRARKTQREMARLARLLLTVSQVGNQFAGLMNSLTLPGEVVRLIKSHFEYQYVSLYLPEGRNLFLAATTAPESAELVHRHLRVLPEEYVPFARCFNLGQMVSSTTDSDSHAHPHLKNLRSHVAVPLHSAGRVSGVLEIASAESGAFSANDGLALQTLADMAAMALRNSQMYQALEELATFDSLTGVVNRRALLQHLEDEWTRSRRYQRAISLVLFDIDHFKQVNDTYGHATGDRALQMVSAMAKQIIRTVDLLGRLGGDEFLLVLPETDARGALEIAERLCQECALMNFSLEENIRIPLTLSLGVVTWPAYAVQNLNELLHAADHALYRSKALGRNRATVFVEQAAGVT